MRNEAHVSAAPPNLREARSKALKATLIGNFMEWYDFAVYGFVAVSIGKAFFPGTSPTASFLASLAVFAVAFFFRPFGGAIFGSIGDRLGRRTSLALSIIVMGVATAVLALLPTHAQIGVFAPILLVIVRCIQGMSVGGEWTGASAFVVEYAPSHRRGLWASAISATAAAGVTTGSLIVLGLNAWLSQESLDSWGWRVPFLVAIPLGLVGLYLRLKLEDTPVFQDLRSRQQVVRSPFRAAMRGDRRQILIAFAFASITGLGFYYFVTYLVNHLSQTVGLSRPSAILVSSASLLVYGALCPLAGALSDRIGRRRTYLLGCAGHLVLAVPVFLLLSSGTLGIVFLGLCMFAVSQALLNVMSSVTIVELFPPATRMTSGAVGYNLGLGPVAGSGPLVAAALVAATGVAIAPALYLAAIALVVGVVLWFFLPETSKRSLTEPAGAEGTNLTASATPQGSGA
jgi:MHS family proline/betaine transporter-like MFS transporter